MSRELVITNIYGNITLLDSLLGKWDKEVETLIVLGNMGNFGLNSFQVYQRLNQLKTAYPDRVVFLKGKHEVLLEKFLDDMQIWYDTFTLSGGMNTILSFSEIGIPFEEFDNKDYLLETVLPEIDFAEARIYLEQAQVFHATESSIYLSDMADAVLTLLTSGTDCRGKSVWRGQDKDFYFQVDYTQRYLDELNTRRSNIKIGPLECDADYLSDCSVGSLLKAAYRVAYGQIDSTILQW